MLQRFSTTNCGDSYLVDGVKYPRVSNILHTVNWGEKPLKDWRYRLFTEALKARVIEKDNTVNLDVAISLYNIADLKVKEAADYGNRFHDTVEDFFNKKITDVELLQKKDITVRSFRKWYKDWGIDKLDSEGCEIPIYSKKYKSAGTTDWMASSDGKLYLLDWKTSNSFRTKYYLQIAAYWIAIEEMYNISIEKAWIVVFNKYRVQYDYRTVDRKDIEVYKDLFLSALKLFYAEEKLK